MLGPQVVLRLVSILSIVTWIPLLVGLVVQLWSPPRAQSDLILAGIAMAVALPAIVLASVTLIRNRPFCIGVSFLLSVVGGLGCGLFGVGLLFYCVIGSLDPSHDAIQASEWFYGLNNTTMAALPVVWAFLWRDYRNDVADQHLTSCCS